jgi:hypothetical protein
MADTTYTELFDNLIVAFNETFLMCGISLGVAILMIVFQKKKHQQEIT